MLRLAPLLLLGGCPTRLVAYTNGDGSELCLLPENIPLDTGNWSGVVDPDLTVEFAEFSGIEPTVILHHAIGACDEVVDPACTVSFDGNDIFVDASASIAFRKDRTDCDGPIQPAIVSCTTPGLDAGTWNFHYADTVITVDVPSSSPLPCAPLNLQEGCSTAPSGMGWIVVPLVWIGRRRRSVGTTG